MVNILCDFFRWKLDGTKTIWLWSFWRCCKWIYNITSVTILRSLHSDIATSWIYQYNIMKLCLIFSLIATVFVAEAKTAKFNCTIRQCNQCATVFYERVGSQLQQKFCGRFLSRGCCRLDNAYGRLFWKGFSEFYNTSSCNKIIKYIQIIYFYFINSLLLKQFIAQQQLLLYQNSIAQWQIARWLCNMLPLELE